MPAGIFLFSNLHEPNECYLTYNIENSNSYEIKNTVLIHRKKETNTLYTINALNYIIRRMNNGILDKTYIINWEIYEDSLLLYNNESLKQIELKFVKRIDVN